MWFITETNGDHINNAIDETPYDTSTTKPVQEEEGTIPAGVNGGFFGRVTHYVRVVKIIRGVNTFIDLVEHIQTYFD